jgi:6-pyruvoyltetrahydropterin/6-carboxytetrahydropterin synthase
MRISRTYHYDSAHWLPLVREGHKCGRMHGHTYQLTVTLAGEPNQQGWVMDFADIDQAVRPWLARLDHRILNDEIPNPTTEEQLLWWWQRLSHSLPVARLDLREGIANTASYTGPDRETN